VYNNRFGGQDEELLRYFGEPTWNFQVVRFLNGNATDIIPRKDRVWTIGELAGRMIEVLKKKHLIVPPYLQLTMLENDTPQLEEAVFSMACFWTGEYIIGKIDGVVGTEAGWFDGREVTRVHFNKTRISLAQLVAQVARERCASRLYLRSDQRVDEPALPIFTFNGDAYRIASQDDQKKQLSLWPELHKIPYLSSMQKMWLNSWGPDNRAKAISVLSPRQKAVLNEILGMNTMRTSKSQNSTE